MIAPAQGLTGPLYVAAKDARGVFGVVFVAPADADGPPVHLVIEHGFKLWDLAVLRAQALNRELAQPEHERDEDARRLLEDGPLYGEAVGAVHERRAQLRDLNPADRFLALVPAVRREGGAA